MVRHPLSERPVGRCAQLAPDPLPDGALSGWSEVLGPVEGVQAENRFHRLEVGIAMNQGNLVFHRDRGDETVRSAEGDTPCLLSRPARSHALSHHSGLNGSRDTGVNHWRRLEGGSDLTSPVISSRRIHSVTDVCPLMIKGLSPA